MKGLRLAGILWLVAGVMSVVRIPPTLRPDVGGERQLEAEGDTVRELLDEGVLVARQPR